MNKQDLIRLTPEQIAAGRKWWERTGRDGQLAASSVDFEENSIKSWIRYVSPKGEERCVLQVDLTFQARTAGAEEMVAMLLGECPRCHEFFITREDNKTLYLDELEYRRAPAWLRVHWEHRCRELNRQPRDADKIPVISSPEPWACAYGCGWKVRVSGGVAADDFSGTPLFSVVLGR